MLSFSKWLLEEMPLQVNLLGKWDKNTPSNYGWDKPSVGILTSPVAVQKIQQKWSRLPQQFNAWMLRGPKASMFQQIGQVTPEYVTQTFGLKIVANPQKPDEINIDPNAINVIFTQNKGDQKMPMNYWIIAHRFGHVVQQNKAFLYFRKELQDDVLHLLQSVFGKGPEKGQYGFYFSNKGRNLLKKFATALGTMGSARKGWLASWEEFSLEILAQYMITGKVTFNRLPFKMIDRYAWGNPQYIRPHWALKQDDFGRWNEYIDYMEDKYQNILESVLDSAVGKIYVM